MSTDRRVTEWTKHAGPDQPEAVYVRISAMCEVTGKVFCVDVPEDEWLTWQAGAMVQEALRSLDADQREFLISGTTPAEWNELMGEEEP